MGIRRLFPWLLAIALVGVVLMGIGFGYMLPAGNWQGAFVVSAVGAGLGVFGLVTLLWGMVFDCLQRPFPREGTRLAYLGLMLLTAPWGALVYYLLVVRRDRQA